jgi:hypothetical protein
MCTQVHSNTPIYIFLYVHISESRATMVCRLLVSPLEKQWFCWLVLCSLVSLASYLPVISYQFHFVLYSHFVPSLGRSLAGPYSGTTNAAYGSRSLTSACDKTRVGHILFLHSHTCLLLSANRLTLLLILGNLSNQFNGNRTHFWKFISPSWMVIIVRTNLPHPFLRGGGGPGRSPGHMINSFTSCTVDDSGCDETDIHTHW